MAFTRSLMRVNDDLGNRIRARALTFADFLEALCRIAWVRKVPGYAATPSSKGGASPSTGGSARALVMVAEPLLTTHEHLHRLANDHTTARGFHYHDITATCQRQSTRCLQHQQPSSPVAYAACQ